MGGFSSLLKKVREPVMRGGGKAEARSYSTPSPPLPFPGAGRRERSAAELARMVESEIIPRLMLAHRPPVDMARPVAGGAVTAGMLEAFLRMTLSSEAPALVGFIESMLRGGMALEDAYVELLIPTARRLGDDWVRDTLSFTDVTIGLNRLQQVVRTFAWKLPPRDDDGESSSAYFAPCPGEQHGFGLLIVDDHFRRAGWRTCFDTTATLDDAADAVAGQWFDVAGFSATSDRPLESIAALVAAVRRASCNRDLFVMLGGGLFVERPGLARELGADACAHSERDALLIAHQAVRRPVFG